jgi:hypothetical protein
MAGMVVFTLEPVVLGFDRAAFLLFLLFFLFLLVGAVPAISDSNLS